jgi:hypothetical protein
MCVGYCEEERSMGGRMYIAQRDSVQGQQAIEQCELDCHLTPH